MTVLASTFIGVPSIPQWAQAIALICTVVAFLFIVVESHIKEGTARRLVMASVIGVVLILLYGSLAPSVVRAYVLIACDNPITWLDWIFWSC